MNIDFIQEKDEAANNIETIVELQICAVIQKRNSGDQQEIVPEVS